MMHSVKIKRHERKHNNMMETEMNKMKVVYGNGRKDERKNSYGVS